MKHHLRRIALALWLLAVACLYFFENGTATRAILMASIMLPSVGLLAAWHSARHLHCAIILPEAATERQVLRGIVQLDAPIWLQLCGVQVMLLLDAPLTGFESSLKLIVDQEAAFELRDPKPGRLACRVESVTVTDLFGLCTFNAAVDAQAEVLIRPMLYPVRLELPQERTAESAGGDTWRYTPPEPGMDELRAYLPGDPVRMIHWKLSAKTDQLLIRQEEAHPCLSLSLLLETTLTEPDAGTMAEAVRAVLSTSATLAEAGHPHRLCWFDHGTGELCCEEISQPEDAAVTASRLLMSSSRIDGESIGTLYRDACPDAADEQILLFSPHADTNAIALLPADVTLVLPPQASFTGSADVKAITMDDRNAVLC